MKASIFSSRVAEGLQTLRRFAEKELAGTAISSGRKDVVIVIVSLDQVTPCRHIDSWTVIPVARRTCGRCSPRSCRRQNATDFGVPRLPLELECRRPSHVQRGNSRQRGSVLL